MDIKALIEKHNAEEVGGRFIAVVNGKRDYIANSTAGGGLELTYVGMQLAEADASQAQEDAAAAARRKPRKQKAETDDVDPDVSIDKDLVQGLSE